MTSETSVAAAELFVAGGRRVIMDGETIVYSLSNWVNSQNHNQRSNAGVGAHWSLGVTVSLTTLDIV